MEINIGADELLIVKVIDDDGAEHTMRLSKPSIIAQGQKLVDGLSLSEIEELEGHRKIMAVKLYRIRTGSTLVEAKSVIENWARKNRCCHHWPYCQHEGLLDGVLMNSLQVSKSGPLALLWRYPASLTKQQALLIMDKKGNKHGLYSFMEINGHTSWMSNA